MNLSEYKDWITKKNKRKSRSPNTKSCRCGAGHLHRSSSEADCCNNLYLLKKAGEIKEIQTEVKFEFKIKGIHICNHYMDFIVTKSDGSVYALEHKGHITDLWSVKSRLFKALYSEIPYFVDYYKPKQKKRK